MYTCVLHVHAYMNVCTVYTIIYVYVYILLLYIKNYCIFGYLMSYSSPKQCLHKRHLYFFYYTSLNSVQNKLAAGPLFSNKAWVRAFYNELEVYAEVFPKLHLSAYVGLEQIMGNMETRLNTETLKPVNQLNYAYGFGIDYDIAKNAGIYIRQRWFHHEDKNFIKEKLFGTETEIELKVFF